jgi:DNA-binding MarR family transcriptional regulator
MKSAARPLNPRMIGEAENAHRALLERVLADTGRAYYDWVTLALVAAETNVERTKLSDTMTRALKIDAATTKDVIAQLTAAGLLEIVGEHDAHLRLTDAGTELHGQIRAAIDTVMARLYGEIPTSDLATAGRVLAQVTLRANDELCKA